MSGTLYLYISSNLGIPAGTSRNFVLLLRPFPNIGHISQVPPELFRLDHSIPTGPTLLQVGGKAMHELDYSSRSLMQLCKTRHPVLLHPARVPDSIRTATLRAAYDSPGVTDLSGILGSARRYLQWGRFHRSGALLHGHMHGLPLEKEISLVPLFLCTQPSFG